MSRLLPQPEITRSLSLLKHERLVRYQGAVPARGRADLANRVLDFVVPQIVSRIVPGLTAKIAPCVMPSLVFAKPLPCRACGLLVSKG